MKLAHYRILIVIYIVIALLSSFSTQLYFFKQIPLELVNCWNYQNSFFMDFRSLSPQFLYPLIFLSVVISFYGTIGLIFYWRHSRVVYMIGILFDLLITLSAKIHLIHTGSLALDFIEYLLAGMIICASCSTAINIMFQKSVLPKPKGTIRLKALYLWFSLGFIFFTISDIIEVGSISKITTIVTLLVSVVMSVLFGVITLKQSEQNPSKKSRIAGVIVGIAIAGLLILSDISEFWNGVYTSIALVSIFLTQFILVASAERKLDSRIYIGNNGYQFVTDNESSYDLN